MLPSQKDAFKQEAHENGLTLNEYATKQLTDIVSGHLSAVSESEINAYREMIQIQFPCVPSNEAFLPHPGKKKESVQAYVKAILPLVFGEEVLPEAIRSQ